MRRDLIRLNGRLFNATLDRSCSTASALHTISRPSDSNNRPLSWNWGVFSVRLVSWFRFLGVSSSDHKGSEGVGVGCSCLGEVKSCRGGESVGLLWAMGSGQGLFRLIQRE